MSILPNAQGVFDIKPKNILDTDIKPSNADDIDPHPSNISMQPLTNQLYTEVIGAFFLIGIGATGITYPVAGTVTSWISP